jgi:hypothetical protein
LRPKRRYTMKLISVAAATAFLVSIGGTAYAQMTKGSPAEAKQLSADPMIKEPTADQLKRNPGLARRDRGPTNGRLGGPPGESRAQAGSVGGSTGGK